MFFENQPQNQKDRYAQLLQLVGSLSRLFSDNPTPYLYYRNAEIAFCKAFEAEDLSRSDVSVDAAKESLGIGLKTFMYRNGDSLEKVAEFNKDRVLYESFVSDPKEMIRIIADLRNERINYAMKLHGLDKSIYHWVARKPGYFIVYEQEMELVNKSKIRNVKKNRNSIRFNDDRNEYNFNFSKSTLFKRFKTPHQAYLIPISVLEDPFSSLEKLLSSIDTTKSDIPGKESIMLPLYSTNKGRKYVPDKSGLNQWNASGRARHPDELYIPIPIWIHRRCPGFLPPRNKCFDLVLPNGEKTSAKTCQEASKKHPTWGKGLMSNPNKNLGHWLLREVLEVPERKLVTYEMLHWFGIDTVELQKMDERTYSLNFKATGTFEDYEEKMFYEGS